MELPNVNDDFMREMRGKAKSYTLVLLRATEKRSAEGADALVWEHGRRNHALRLQGVLSVVCPIVDGGEWRGIGIFDAKPEEVKTIMDGDPAVQGGLFTYEIHPVFGFPGDSLR